MEMLFSYLCAEVSRSSAVRYRFLSNTRTNFPDNRTNGVFLLDASPASDLRPVNNRQRCFGAFWNFVTAAAYQDHDCGFICLSDMIRNRVQYRRRRILSGVDRY